MIQAQTLSEVNRTLSSSCLMVVVETTELTIGHTRKGAITCLESNTSRLSMVDITVNIISIIIISNTDLSIQITRSAHKIQAIVATQAVIILEDVAKATISTITKAIVAIKTNLVVIMLLEAKVDRKALQITTLGTTSSQTTEAVVATITSLIME